MVDTEAALTLVKDRLNRLDSRLDSYLLARINAAIDYLENAGIALTDSAGDLMLVVDVAVWQYQNRDSGAHMPEWLRLRRRERWLKLRAEEGGT